MSRFITKPFKGQYYYEIQILSLVFQWRHDDNHVSRGIGGNKVLKIGRLGVWYDVAWKNHMLPRWIRR